ncbi:hypothetical protein LPJ66_008148 [Kickxella alabastrina]|uniref:Uncharacterized protein n=1 Tax=Kickxella alabastrina TaxID=61397 RepID=A0ACC1I973_9FUNG|nr:hypothetical protein LPJ66_008148 [Kickxella alabastrina]
MPVASTPRTTTPSKRVLDSAQFISRRSHDVSVPTKGILHATKEIQHRMKQSNYSTSSWKSHPLNPKTADSSAIEWIFLIDALNFSFWTSRPTNEQYAVTLDEKTYRGYWSLCAAVNRAQREGVDLADARVYARISEDELRQVFRTDDPQVQEEIPMFQERLHVLHEVGRVLVDKYQGRFANLLKECHGSAQAVVERVVGEFPCFRDEHLYRGKSVAMYKRAQILVADLWACFEGCGAGAFKDIDQVTMFADYRVPQALYHFGALRYSPRLMKHLREDGKLPSGHPWEVEIRANSIWAVECIRRQLQADGCKDINAVLIDFYMWDYAKDNAEAMQDIPIHLTRSVFY